MNNSERIQTYVRSHPGCTSTEMAKDLGLPGGNVSATLASLANQGQVTRHADARPIRWTLAGVPLPGTSAGDDSSAPPPPEAALSQMPTPPPDGPEDPDGLLDEDTDEQDAGGWEPGEMESLAAAAGVDLAPREEDPEPEGEILPVPQELLTGEGAPPPPRDGQLTMLRQRVLPKADRALLKLREAIDLRLDEAGDPLLSAMIDSYLDQLHVRAGLD